MTADSSLTPEKILNDYKSNKVDREETIYLLKTLIERSNDVSIQLRSIEAIANIKSGNEAVFKILESCIVSGEDQLIREKAVQILYRLFPLKSLSVLEWAIKHEQSSFVLNSLFKLSKEMCDSQHPKLCSISEKIVSKLSDFYGVVPNEIPFYLELNTILNKAGGKLTRREFEIPYCRTNILNREYYIMDLYYSCHGETVYVVYNKKTRALIIPELAKIPDSLSNLTRLRYLSLLNLKSVPKALNTLHRLNGLELRVYKGKKLKFPNSIINMHSLKELHLHSTFFTPISKLFVNHVKKNIAPKYVKDGVNFEDAVNLGLLDVYFRHKLERNYGYNHQYVNFDTDQEGRVKTIDLAGVHEFYAVDLDSIPEPIFRFKFLENLRLCHNFICYISPKIKRLKNLKVLDVSNNPITKIPKSIAKLRNLEKADFSATKIKEIPEELKSFKALHISYGDYWD